jgi:hypothetical protein
MCPSSENVNMWNTIDGKFVKVVSKKRNFANGFTRAFRTESNCIQTTGVVIVSC